jgi:hypothetical protein
MKTSTSLLTLATGRWPDGTRTVVPLLSGKRASTVICPSLDTMLHAPDGSFSKCAL